MEKIVRQSMLYDFYGELLTEHQKSIYEDVVVNDLSYSEIANLNGISRQGVYDLIKRCDKILEEYEAKLRLVEKFVGAKRMAEKIKAEIDALEAKGEERDISLALSEISKLTEALIAEF